MSHVYQPVMLIELLMNNGAATVTGIAKALSVHDPSQVEYYERITRKMPGRVLTQNRGIARKDKNRYFLVGFESLTGDEVKRLIEYCEQRIEEFIQKRGDKIWDHRRKSSGYVPGTLKYEILKRAKFVCELCGTPASEKALEVDHIKPRNAGGSDDPTNLQALCYACNAMKRDRDDTDFRGVGDVYGEREAGCLFCETPSSRIVAEHKLAFAIRDKFPVTELHTLVIPRRHVPDYFGLFYSERNAVNELLEQEMERIRQRDETVQGFNIGNNIGAAAGQTIMHCHTHLIPRRWNDVKAPRGGVRGVIPGKQDY